MTMYIHSRKFSLPLSLLVFICAPLTMKAQTDTVTYPEQFLFPHFATAKVMMKGGKDFDMILNYNIVFEKVVIVQKNLICDLSNTGSVDTIYLLNRKFVPAGQVFYELLIEKPFVLFVQHRSNVSLPPKMDSYGKISETSATDAKKFLLIGNKFNISSDQELLFNKEEVYWLKSNESIQSFRNAMELFKIFPQVKGEIRLYIRQNRLKFESPEDVIKLIIYCNTLIK